MQVFLRCAARTSYMPNQFPTKACDCRILFILRGKGKITIEGKGYTLCPNTLCYYPTGTEYYPISSKTEPLYFITINFDLNRKRTDRPEVQPTVRAELFQSEKAIFSHNDCCYELFHHPFVLSNAVGFRESLLRVSAEFSEGRGNEPAASALLQYLLLKIAEPSYEGTGEVTLCERVIAYINKNYANIESNRKIADALGYHDYYLNRVFKEQMGTTLHRYLIDLRLKKAAETLKTSELTVSEVAKSVGFFNADHFSKRFYKKYALTPSQYRRQNSAIQLV